MNKSNLRGYFPKVRNQLNQSDSIREDTKPETVIKILFQIISFSKDTIKSNQRRNWILVYFLNRKEEEAANP